MKKEEEINKKLEGYIHTMNSQMGEKVCMRASIQADVLKWVLEMICQTCGNDKGKPRVDNGLACGIHCDDCFEKMVSDCRSRSW